MRHDSERRDTNNSRRIEDVNDSPESFEDLEVDYREDEPKNEKVDGKDRRASRINLVPVSARDILATKSIRESEGRFFVPVFCKLRFPFDVYRFKGEKTVRKRRDIVSTLGRYRNGKKNAMFVSVIEEDRLCIDPIRLKDITSQFLLSPIACERHVKDIWFFSWFVADMDLGKLLRQDRDRRVFGEAHAQFVTAGLLLAVEHLHDLQIVHGNIQPSCVIISNKGTPVLSGLERAYWAGDGSVITTKPPNLRYSAPERILYDIVDTSGDIFSIGCIAYEITAGRPPFWVISVEETLDRIVNDDVKPTYSIDAFSFAGEIFIGQCLSKDPEVRLELDPNMSILYNEEWFSSLDLESLNGTAKYKRSLLLDAMKQIDQSLDWEQKRTYYDWGQVMDTICPYHPSIDAEEEEAKAQAIAYFASLMY